MRNPDIAAKLGAASDVQPSMTPPHLALTLDETKMSAGEFVAFVDATVKKIEPGPNSGADLVVRVDTAMCAMEKKMCPACFIEVPKAIKGVKGVTEVTLDETGKTVQVKFAPDARVTTADLARALTANPNKFTSQFAGIALPEKL